MGTDLGDQLLFGKYVSDLNSSKLLENIITDLKTVSLLIFQEGSLLKNCHHIDTLPDPNIIGPSASRLSRLLSYYYILNQSLLLIDKSEKVEEISNIEKDLQKIKVMFKKYCFYCKSLVPFTICDMCSKKVCVPCGLLDRDLLDQDVILHKPCYAQKYNKGDKWLKEQTKNRYITRKS